MTGPCKPWYTSWPNFGVPYVVGIVGCIGGWRYERKSRAYWQIRILVKLHNLSILLWKSSIKLKRRTLRTLRKAQEVLSTASNRSNSSPFAGVSTSYPLLFKRSKASMIQSWQFHRRLPCTTGQLFKTEIICLYAVLGMLPTATFPRYDCDLPAFSGSFTAYVVVDPVSWMAVAEPSSS